MDGVVGHIAMDIASLFRPLVRLSIFLIGRSLDRAQGGSGILGQDIREPVTGVPAG